jgi:hypothetical protein
VEAGHDKIHALQRPMELLTITLSSPQSRPKQSNRKVAKMKFGWRATEWHTKCPNIAYYYGDRRSVEEQNGKRGDLRFVPAIF